MNDGRKEYIFTWFIENYSYCWHKNGEGLYSPEFTANDMDRTVWKMKLCPRGERNECKSFISIFLHRSEDDGPENIHLKYELSVLAADGSILNSLEGESTFTKRIGYGFLGFVHIDDVLVRRKAVYLPQDCLCVRCKIWKGEGNIHPVAKLSARTRIGIERISFVHAVENFRALEPNQKKTIEIRSAYKNGITLSSSLYFTDGPCCHGKIIVEVTPTGKYRILSKCKISILDESGKKIKCGEIDNRDEATRNAIEYILLSLTRQVILNKKSQYIHGDKLSLACECTFSTGVEYEKIDRSIYGEVCSTENEINVEDQDNNIYKEKLLAFPSALDELKTIYNKQHLTDVELQTQTKSFPAHKVVLCARSSVFNAMLTNDMKEKNTGVIRVDDMDDDILQQFLLFLYSDDNEKLHWESAIKLYNAANQYKVEKLKMLCSSFLVDNLNTSNASELLLAADTHNDCDLMKIVEDYILKHEEKVFGSDEWGNLMEKNPLLVSKTMRLKYISKFQSLEFIVNQHRLAVYKYYSILRRK